MKAARKRSKRELVEGFKQWLDNHVGIVIAESRPNSVYKLWVEEVYMRDEVPEQLLELLRGVLRATGGLRVEITTGADGDVRLLRVSKEF